MDPDYVPALVHALGRPDAHPSSDRNIRSERGSYRSCRPRPLGYGFASPDVSGLANDHQFRAGTFSGHGLPMDEAQAAMDLGDLHRRIVLRAISGTFGGRH